MCEDMAMPALADQFSTPLYVYSQSAIVTAFNEWRAAFEGARHLVCYAVKANSNIAVLKLLASLGSGFDIVSGGELGRVLAAGGRPPRKVVFLRAWGKINGRDRVSRSKTGIRCF